VSGGNATPRKEEQPDQTETQVDLLADSQSAGEFVHERSTCLAE
jgi:hypothetical protein